VNENFYLRILSCTFINNRAINGDGSIVYMPSTSVPSQELSLTTCTVSDNTAGTNRGIRYGGDVAISTSNNYSRNVASGGLGAVMYMTTLDAVVTVSGDNF